METKRQLDVLDRHLADNEYMAGGAYSIADMAIWPWYGNVVAGTIYEDSATFLEAHSYTNVVRWQKQLAARPALKRGRLVKRLSGCPTEQLHERHEYGRAARRGSVGHYGWVQGASGS